jgi:hypothetical protein
LAKSISQKPNLFMQKPGLLTTFGRSNYHNFISLDIKDLTPATYGQFIPAKGGQGHRLFQLTKYHYENSINWCGIGRKSGASLYGLSSLIDLHPSFSPVTPYILNSLQIGDCGISS